MFLWNKSWFWLCFPWLRSIRIPAVCTNEPVSHLWHCLLFEIFRNFKSLSMSSSKWPKRTSVKIPTTVLWHSYILYVKYKIVTKVYATLNFWQLVASKHAWLVIWEASRWDFKWTTTQITLHILFQYVLFSISCWYILFQCHDFQ